MKKTMTKLFSLKISVNSEKVAISSNIYAQTKLYT